jgi:hypothetical protein
MRRSNRDGCSSALTSEVCAVRMRATMPTGSMRLSTSGVMSSVGVGTHV